MKNDLLSNTFQKKILANLESDYYSFVNDLRLDLEQGFTTDIVDVNFLDQLNDIIHDENFDKYSPLKFYWLNLVDNLIYIIQLHEELLLEEDVSTDELTELEDELFNFWNDSELAESFLNFLNEGSPVIEASTNLLPLLENQIISFYVLHINIYHQEFDDALMYQIVPELGDSEKRIYIGDKHLSIELPKKPDSYPHIPIRSIDLEKEKLVIEIHDKDIELKIKNNAKVIQFGSGQLTLVSQCENGDKNLKKFSENIETALHRIKKCSPDLLNTLFNFTHTIIPVDEKNIVSYSMQSLPGYSCVNMFDRDQIDLMDDLLHENGHHYLNSILNQTDLINEDDEKIYYSPWRRALRPIRGIYHAVFTFYWAMELFAMLSKETMKKSLYKPEEIIKINKRFCEEFLMLNYCKQDLKHAYKLKKTNKDGHDLIESIYSKIDLQKSFYKDVLKQLSSTSSGTYKELVALEKHLTETRTHYQLI